MNLNGYKVTVLTTPESAGGSGKVLVVTDRKNGIIGRADPYPGGIPVQTWRRKQLEKQTALQLIAAQN